MTSVNIKPVELLSGADLQAHHVWQYINQDEHGETLVRPVKRVPVATLSGRVVGAEVRLANSACVWALLGNVDVGDARLTGHFLMLSVLRDGRWFALSRYHDFDYAKNGPEALAGFLGLSVDEVFPIAYDIRAYATGEPAALVGIIPKEPSERLSRAENHCDGGSVRPARFRNAAWHNLHLLPQPFSRGTPPAVSRPRLCPGRVR